MPRRCAKPVARAAIVIAAAVLAHAGTANATDIEWNRAAGNPGNIGDGSNWTGGTAPGALDTGLINNGGIATASAFTGTYTSLRLGVLPSSSGTVLQTGGSVTTSADLILGDDTTAGNNGAGTYSAGGGSLTTGNFYIGNNSIGTALFGGGTVTSNTIHVGQQATAVGTALQTAGLVTSTGNMVIGEMSTGANLYSISAGTLSVGFGVGTGELFVGATGNGTLNISGTGAVNVRNFLHFGNDGAGAGTLIMSGGTLNVQNGLFQGMITIGDNSVGTAVISGGVINTKYFAVGQGSFGSGTVTQTGGFVNAAFNLVIHEGHSLPGTNPDFYTMSAGSIAVGNEMYIGAHGPATFNLSGTGSITIGGTLHIGASDAVNDPPAGFGTLNMNGGTINVTGANAHIVIADGGGGTFNFMAGSVTTKFYNTGQNPGALGLVNQTGGSATAQLSMVVGETSLGDNLYDLSGGSVTVLGAAPSFGQMYLGGINGKGTLKVRGTGSLTVASSAHLGSGASSSGTMNISGGTVILGTDGLGTAVCIVGDNGIGALIVSSGALTTPLMTLGSNATALGTGTQTGGTVNVTSNMSVGETSVADNVYDISGGTLAVTGDIFVGSNGNGTLKVRGTGSVSAASIQNQPTGAGTINVSGGTLAVLAMNNRGLYTQSAGAASVGVVTGAGQMAVSGGSLTASSIAQGTLLLSSTGRVNITPNGGDAGTSRVTAVSVTGSSKLDLADNDLIVDYITTSPLAAIQAAIVSGFAGGAWTGNGINSSSAAAAALSPNKTALGYAEATDLFTTFPATFSGQSVDNTSVLVRYTASGDANLDGTVDTVDFNLLAANFSGSGKRWTQGDFNYDTFVDTVDFNLLASNFSFTVPAGSFGSLVPEPASLGVLGLSAYGLVRRRRGFVSRLS